MSGSQVVFFKASSCHNFDGFSIEIWRRGGLRKEGLALLLSLYFVISTKELLGWPRNSIKKEVKPAKNF